MFLPGLLLRLHHQNFPGKPPQSELEAGLVRADGRGEEQLLEHDVLPGVVQVRGGCQVVKISQGRQFLQQNIFRIMAMFVAPFTLIMEQLHGTLLSPISKSPIGTFCMPGMLSIIRSTLRKLLFLKENWGVATFVYSIADGSKLKTVMKYK